MHIRELVRLIGAEADEGLDFEVRGLATIEDAGPHHVTVLANATYGRALRESKAGAVLVARSFDEEVPTPLQTVHDPDRAVAKALREFHT